MTVRVTFLGGAGTVTGSKFLLECEQHRILVDCGLFQGFKVLRLRNWEPLPVDPGSIDTVILTHAHLDHSGYLPLLVRNGFRGLVFCTASTAELCGILLPDSGHLQERDAEFANRYGFSKHKPALPLYTERDAVRALTRLSTLDFDDAHRLSHGASLRFRRAGHILGAASVEISVGGKTVVFSGDLGRFGDPLMPEPDPVPRADYLVLESTYGDRVHPETGAEDALSEVIARTVHRGGTVLVPAFAVGRAQSVLHYIERIRTEGRVPSALQVFLDSPMAIDASEIFYRHPKDHKLTPAQCATLSSTAHYVRTGEESKRLTATPMPKVIISASGMATGGRILHHLKHYAPDPRNTILFTGFQAGGTRGAAMVAGASEIKVHGEYIPVRAEVQNLEMLSAHADSREIVRWLGGFSQPPRKTFIVHGEPTASDALRRRIEEQLRWDVVVPELTEQRNLT